MVVPSTADGFRAVVSALRSLDGKDGEFSHLHAPRGPMCATPGKEPRQGYAGERGQGGAGIPEHLCSGSHAAAIWTSRIRPLQGPFSHPHFIVSVARGPEVSKVRSITELCGLRVSVESYLAPKGPLQCRRCQRFGHTQRNCGYAPRCVACGGSHLSSGCSTPRDQPACCGCGVTTQRVTVAVLSGRRRGRLLLSKRPSAAGRASPQPNLPLQKPSGPVLLPSRRALARGGITSSKGGVLSRPRESHPTNHTIIPLIIRSRWRTQRPQ